MQSLLTIEPGLKGQNSSLIIWGLFGSHELFVICVENWILDEFALLSFYVKNTIGILIIIIKIRI